MDSLLRPNDDIEDLLDIIFPVVAVPEVATHDPITDVDDVPELIHQVGAAVIAVPDITKMIKSNNIHIPVADCYADCYLTPRDMTIARLIRDEMNMQTNGDVFYGSRLADKWPSLCPATESAGYEMAGSSSKP